MSYEILSKSKSNQIIIALNNFYKFFNGSFSKNANLIVSTDCLDKSKESLKYDLQCKYYFTSVLIVC